MANLKSNRAFVLLYAVLVASVVLAIGFSLANIITKQIILSSLGQSSRVAYYAADGGRNCGRFWSNVEKFTGSPFDVTTRAHCSTDINDFITISKVFSPLETKLLNLYKINLSAYNYQAYTLSDINFNNEACAKVTIFSFDDDPSKTPNYRTIVLSRGFSASCTTPVSSRSVSRTVISTDIW